MKTVSFIIGVICGFGQTASAEGLCLRDTEWSDNIAPHQQQMEVELVKRDGENAIVAVRFSPLEGEYAKLFGFFLHDGTCVVRAYVVGAFAAENSQTLVEAIPEQDTIYYNQDYYSAETQLRVGVSEAPPDYDAALDEAIKLLGTF